MAPTAYQGMRGLEKRKNDVMIAYGRTTLSRVNIDIY